jgi:hypothetical protein
LTTFSKNDVYVVHIYTDGGARAKRGRVVLPLSKPRPSLRAAQGELNRIPTVYFEVFGAYGGIENQNVSITHEEH